MRNAHNSIRLLIADDHSIIKEGFKNVFADHEEIKLVGLACNGREAVEMAETENPDVIIMDVRMPVMCGREATSKIASKRPHVRVLAFSMCDGGFAGAYAEGANNGVRTRLSDGKQLDYGVQLHEMLHQLTTRPGEREHDLGGGLAVPAQNLNTRNVNAVLLDALKSVTPVRVKKK